MNKRRWVVCESKGRLAAALHVAGLRHKRHMGPSAPPGRILQTRSLAELEAALATGEIELAVLEVTRESFHASLELLTRASRWPTPIAVVLPADRFTTTDTVPETEETVAGVVDALREAGAAAVLETPRHLPRLLAIAGRLEGVSRKSLVVRR
ncbi:MAG: hypothetical protein IT425_05810 [Pirellulales bacterium]|nr:hypothetical protein [Pirellulales bacterium]